MHPLQIICGGCFLFIPIEKIYREVEYFYEPSHHPKHFYM